MEHSKQMIRELASAFSKGTCPQSLYINALESLVRLAISEHLAAPMLAVQADLQRVAEIQAAARVA